MAARLLKTYVALMLLAALTLGASFLRLGPLNVALALAIAGAKAALIAIQFMELRKSARLTRAFACAGLVWLSILIGLTINDYLSRGWMPLPADWPSKTDPLAPGR